MTWGKPKRTWTAECEKLLKTRWAEGKSATRIAAEIGGISRNSVIGKVHRLGLSGRRKTPAPSIRKPGHPRPPPPKPNRTDVTPFKGPPKLPDLPLPVVELVAPSESRCTLLDLTNSKCKWPIGTVGDPDFHFCGGKSIEGLPYCGPHCRLAYQAGSGTKRKGRAA